MPRPERVHSTCNCGGVLEHQVSHCGILERNYEIIIYGTRNLGTSARVKW